MLTRKVVGNSIFHIFKVKILMFLHKVCKAFHISVYFQNRYGIKALNKPLFNSNQINVDGTVVEIDCKLLFLGYDALKDKYTLTDVPLSESPHYELISRLYSGFDNFEKCDYIYREKLGYLDGRMGQIVGKKVLDAHKKAFKRSLKLIQQGSYKEVLVYEANERYYLLDGKHRAALCTVLNLPIKCRIIDSKLLRRDCYTINVCKKMKKHPESYKKNIKLLDTVWGRNMENKKQVLLLNRKNTDNLGDQAINIAMKNLIEELGAECIDKDLSSYRIDGIRLDKNKPQNPKASKRPVLSFIRGIPFIKKQLWITKHRELYRVLTEQQFDIVVIGGGELIQPNGTFPYALYWWTKQILRYQKKPKIVLFSVGVTSDWPEPEKKLILSTLENISEVYVRDENSAKNLKSIFKRDSKLVPDSVFINSLHKPLGTDYVLYGLTNYERILKHLALYDSINEYFEVSYEEILKAKQEYKKEVLLFYTTQSDLYTCKEFQEFCLSKYNQLIEIASIATLEDLERYIKKASVVYSPRMHACILAKINSIPTQPICISQKIKSFESRYGKLEEKDYLTLSNELRTAMSQVLAN